MRALLLGLVALLFPLALMAQDLNQPGVPMSPGAAAAREDYLAGRYVAALAQARPLAEAGDAAAQNLMGAAYTEMGVAHAAEAQSRMGVYWTQLFGAPAPAK